MQKEIGEERDQCKFSLYPSFELVSFVDKLWTGERTQLKQKKEWNLLILPPALSDQHQEANFFRSIQVQFESNSHAAPVL